MNDHITIFDFNKKNFQTSRGIGIGSNINEIEKEYGQENYKFTDDQGRYVIGYIDREHKIRLECYHIDNKVYEISIRKLNKANGDRKIFGKWI